MTHLTVRSVCCIKVSIAFVFSCWIKITLSVYFTSQYFLKKSSELRVMLRQSFPDIMGDTATEQESGKFHDGVKTTLVIANC